MSDKYGYRIDQDDFRIQFSLADPTRYRCLEELGYDISGSEWLTSGEDGYRLPASSTVEGSYGFKSDVRIEHPESLAGRKLSICVNDVGSQPRFADEYEPKGRLGEIQHWHDGPGPIDVQLWLKPSIAR